ncbi:MAG: phosphoribosyltransferase family protein [Desulfurococcales archaeon]|jgi:adenine/guanine phosphoribosyltransferase-like PRPP-binding protein|nr:phosphoribosyltransferase family protein [Desulfurococcales archaeon]
MIVKDERYICITALKLVKKNLKYSDLQEVLGISAPVLWRYIAGVVRPTKERASEILRTLIEKGVLRRVITKRLKLVDGDVVNMYSLVYSTDILWLASIEAYYYFKDQQLDVALTTEVDGIPVGLAIASMLDLDLVVAKRRKELGFSEFYEETYLSRDPPSLVTLYVPRESLKKGSRVLIVDDLLRSGRTLKALINIVKQAKAEVAGIFSLVAVGNEWRDIIKDLNVRTVVLINR